MITIRDVAKLSRVSTMTVSRAVNNSGYISQETRERVERAISELGYVPNALARSLRFKQTKTIALVVTDITNPFFTTVARGVEDAASEQGFSVMFCNTDESESEEIEYIDVLLRKQVDGVLLVPARSSSESISRLQSHSIPIVVLDRRVSDVEVDVVRGDSEEGSYQLVQHLLGLGHERIDILSGPLCVSTSADRVAGYRQAMSNAGLEGNESVYHDAFTLDSGYRMARQALAEVPRPTALFAANNFLAIGALRTVRALGLTVPGDISIVAFDDIPQQLVVDPFLTVVTQPAYEMGRRATELLLERLAGDTVSEAREIVLTTELIVRKSSAPPPALAVAGGSADAQRSNGRSPCE